MKYLNKYSSWRKINEEISDTKVVDAANQHEKEGRPQKADELRIKVEPNYKDEFEFYFFPLSIKGDIVTFRAYVDNRGDAVKVSRFLKVFNKLTGLPEVNNLWREIQKTHKSEGLVTINYSGNSRFMFKPSGGYFVSHHGEHYANPTEVQVGPIVLYHDFPFTHMVSGSKFLDYAHFSPSGPYQIIKINFDPTEGILKADIKIDFGGMADHYNEEVIRVAGGTIKEKEKEKPKEIENCDELINAIGMYSQRPKASLEKLSQLRPELTDILTKEVTFVLRKAYTDTNRNDLVKISKDPHNITNIYKAYVESDKDAKDINEVIKLFLQLRAFKSNGNIMSVDGYNEDDLITEKKEGDVEVKAKFIPQINPGLRRSTDSFEFFGFQFTIEEDKFDKNDSRILTNLLDDTAYITLIDEYSDSFKGSKLFTTIPKY
jgi:hypothetical protein